MAAMVTGQSANDKIFFYFWQQSVVPGQGESIISQETEPAVGKVYTSLFSLYKGQVIITLIESNARNLF